MSAKTVSAWTKHVKDGNHVTIIDNQFISWFNHVNQVTYSVYFYSLSVVPTGLNPDADFVLGPNYPWVAR